MPERISERKAEPIPDRSTQLAIERTELAGHRSELASHRTVMANTRSHLANERTHLAYLRTALSLMSFGITINRFSIYLREIKSPPRTFGVLYETEFVGIGMVVVGILILCWGLFRYRKVNHDIETDSYSSPDIALTILSMSILFLGGFSAVWMILSRV